MASPPANYIKTCARSHSTLGLFVAALLYLVCVSGSVLVFKEDIERWEQPLAEEKSQPSYEAIETRFNNVLANKDVVTEHMYLVFPTPSLPRYKIASENQGWYLNASAELDTQAHTYFADLLSHLHTYLHLPSSIGIYIVSMLGVLLTALIVSGFLSHPNIIKDAFSWRRKNSARLYETDTHNRLSVWGAPFYLMIALTGTYFGFIGILLAAYSQVQYDGNQQAVIEEIFGKEPQLTQQPDYVALKLIMTEVSNLDSEGTPLFLIVHDAGEDSQFVEVFVQQPGRFLYSENYRFDVRGNYLGTAGFTEGSLGKQIAYSTYRLHFGLFSGFPVRLFYFVLGMCLTVICVTGVNTWLHKRKHEDFINPLWAAVVWGVPLSLLVSAVYALALKSNSPLGFWLPFIACLLTSSITKNSQRFKRILLSFNAIAAIALIICHIALFGWILFAPVARLITIALLSYIVVLIYFLKSTNNITTKITDINAEIVIR